MYTEHKHVITVNFVFSQKQTQVMTFDAVSTSTSPCHCHSNLPTCQHRLTNVDIGRPVTSVSVSVVKAPIQTVIIIIIIIIIITTSRCLLLTDKPVCYGRQATVNQRLAQHRHCGFLAFVLLQTITPLLTLLLTEHRLCHLRSPADE